MIEELLKEREILKIFAKGKTSPVAECFYQNDQPSNKLSVAADWRPICDEYRGLCEESGGHVECNLCR